MVMSLETYMDIISYNHETSHRITVYIFFGGSLLFLNRLMRLNLKWF